jgi:hypothetical protein
VTETDMAALDFSVGGPADGSKAPVDIQALIDEASLGTRTNEGMYEVKDWEIARSSKTTDSTTDDVIAQALQGRGAEEKDKEAGGALGTFGGLFSRFTGGKALTEQDLVPVLEAMKQQLMKKNVAKEIADKVCEGVGEGLVGKKIGNFQSGSLFWRGIYTVSYFSAQQRMPLFGRRCQTRSPASSRRRRQRTCCCLSGPSWHSLSASHSSACLTVSPSSA